MSAQALPGKIHLCVDGWTSPNYMSFLGVTAHWGDGDGLEHVTLDFIKWVCSSDTINFESWLTNSGLG